MPNYKKMRRCPCEMCSLSGHNTQSAFLPHVKVEPVKEPIPGPSGYSAPTTHTIKVESVPGIYGARTPKNHVKIEPLEEPVSRIYEESATHEIKVESVPGIYGARTPKNHVKIEPLEEPVSRIYEESATHEIKVEPVEEPVPEPSVYRVPTTHAVKVETVDERVMVEEIPASFFELAVKQALLQELRIETPYAIPDTLVIQKVHKMCKTKGWGLPEYKEKPAGLQNVKCRGMGHRTLSTASKKPKPIAAGNMLQYLKMKEIERVNKRIPERAGCRAPTTSMLNIEPVRNPVPASSGHRAPATQVIKIQHMEEPIISRPAYRGPKKSVKKIEFLTEPVPGPSEYRAPTNHVMEVGSMEKQIQAKPENELNFASESSVVATPHEKRIAELIASIPDNRVIDQLHSLCRKRGWGLAPEFKVKKRPAHVHKVSCRVLDYWTLGTASRIKDAKHIAIRKMLMMLHANGEFVGKPDARPSAYKTPKMHALKVQPTFASVAAAVASQETRTAALIASVTGNQVLYKLHNLCRKRGWEQFPMYKKEKSDCVQNVECRVLGHMTLGTASNTKKAKQISARKMLKYFI